MAELRGPFFAPGADTVFGELVRQSQRRVAMVAHARLQILMRAFFRRPRPFYWTVVHTRPRASYWVVTDGGFTPYGHWLEGTGKRNRETRFKGYRHWQITTRSMHSPGTIERLAQPSIDAAVKALN